MPPIKDAPIAIVHDPEPAEGVIQMEYCTISCAAQLSEQ